MAFTKIITAESKDKRLQLDIPVPRDGCFDIHIFWHKKKYSALQNKYYWGVVIPFIQSFFLEVSGIKYTTAGAHLQFKDIAGLYEDIKIIDVKTGKQVLHRDYKSFSSAGDLKAEDFMQAVDLVREAIFQFSNRTFILPEPNNEK